MDNQTQDRPSLEQLDAVMDFASRYKHRPEWMSELEAVWRHIPATRPPLDPRLIELRESDGFAWLERLRQGDPIGSYRGWTINYNPTDAKYPLLARRGQDYAHCYDGRDVGSCVDVLMVVLGD